MFEGPEFASYLELCRALRLEREWEHGDFWTTGPWITDPSYLEVSVYSECDDDEGNRVPAEAVWLPRLDQWLVSLEEAITKSYERSAMTSPPRAGYARFQALGMLQVRVDRFPHESTEEAAALLWLAVTGREAPRG